VSTYTEACNKALSKANAAKPVVQAQITDS